MDAHRTEAAHSLLSLAHPSQQILCATRTEATTNRSAANHTINALRKVIKELMKLGFRAKDVRNANYPEIICKCLERYEHLITNKSPPYKLEPYPDFNTVMVCGPRVLCTHCNAYFAIRKDGKIRKHDCAYYRIQVDLAKAQRLIRKMR